MKLCKPNNGLKPIETLPDIPSSLGNISNPKIADMINLGWRVFSPCEYNEYIKATTWTDDGIYYTESITESWTQEELDTKNQEAKEAELNRVFCISKLKLLRTLRGMGLEDTFMSYIQQDTNRLRDWDIAVVLMSDDPLVLEGSIALAEFICPSAVTNSEKIIKIREWLKTNCQSV